MASAIFGRVDRYGVRPGGVIARDKAVPTALPQEIQYWSQRGGHSRPDPPRPLGSERGAVVQYPGLGVGGDAPEHQRQTCAGLFHQAKKNSLGIVFIDEIEAGGARLGLRLALLSTLLDRDNIPILAGTCATGTDLAPEIGSCQHRSARRSRTRHGCCWLPSAQDDCSQLA